MVLYSQGVPANVRIYFADGLVGTPSITFSSDTNSGFYSVGADQIGVVTNGTEKMRFYSSSVALGSSMYLISASTQSLTLKGNVSDGATAVGMILDNAVALTTSGSKIISVRNNNVEKFSIDKDGTTVLNTLFCGGITDSSSASTLTIKGVMADGATAVGVTLNTVSYTTGGAKLVSFTNDGTEKAYCDKDGIIYSETNKRTACGGGSTGGTTTANGTVTLEINGTTYYLLKAAGA